MCVSAGVKLHSDSTYIHNQYKQAKAVTYHKASKKVVIHVVNHPLITYIIGKGAVYHTAYLVILHACIKLN